MALSDNNFWGQLTDTFGILGNLETIDVSSNLIDGAIPGSIFDAPSIRLVYLSENDLSGPLPTNYGSAVELRDLYLDGNKLTGEIPPIEDGQLQNLNEFLVSVFLFKQSDSILGLFPVL